MTAAQKFELFYDDPFDPILIASFEELAAANAAMGDFALHVPGQYFVWSREEDQVAAQLSTGSSLLGAWWLAK